MSATTATIPSDFSPDLERSSCVVREESPPVPAPEQRMLVHNVGWAAYLTLDGVFTGTSGRVYWCDGVTEIMSISALHERIKQMISHLVSNYCLRRDIEYSSEGSATRQRHESRGAEPDDSFFFPNAAGYSVDRPDVVLEIVLTSGGLNKAALYAPFGIPELWIYEDGGLKIFTLSGGRYAQQQRSRCLPDLDIALVSELAARAGAGESISALLKEFIRRQA